MPISDVSSDLTVEVGTSSFALHRVPLVSRSGRIRKLVSESKDSRIHFPSVPGGVEAFKQATKFCYGINIDITISNVAMLRCVAHFLEMTAEYSEKSLETRTEKYLKDIVLPSITNSISVLHKCEALLPVAEDINLVDRIITSIADNVCKEQLSLGLSKLDGTPATKPVSEKETPVSWWGESLTVLNLDLFQRVLSALKVNGLKQDLLTKILINYAHSSLFKGNLLDLELQKKQKVIIEAMVRLLPTQSRKSLVPIAFLSGLLKSAVSSSVSMPCRSNLERRIALQLDRAILEDILIPCGSNGSDNSPLYDTDSVLRIFSNFLNLDDGEDLDHNDEDNSFGDESDMMHDMDSSVSPKQSSIVKVSKLLDNYLAEVALDPNLTPSKFTALAELLPDHARVVTDGLYRAVDIFLKVHPNVKDSERYQICKTIDCQKLSQEACSHAAQNERLPVQMAVQVLYFEQIRLRNTITGPQNSHFLGSFNGHFTQSSSCGVGSGVISPRDHYASVRRENRELKLEVARMRMRLTDLEKDHVSMKKDMTKPNLVCKLFKSLVKQLCRCGTNLFRSKNKLSVGSKGDSETNKLVFLGRRCHSV